MPALTLQSPDVLVDGCWSSSDEIDAEARRWRAAIEGALGENTRLVAAALPTSSEGVALFIALSSLTSPLVLFGPTSGAWRSEPPLPAGTPFVLPASLSHLASDVREMGGAPFVLSEAGATPSAALAPLQTPGLVHFTSGSAGRPKPVYRTIDALLGAATARLRALGMTPGDGIITGVPLAHGQGLSLLLSSMALASPFALLGPVDHRAALAAIAMPAFKLWWATPHFADVLGRCALTAPPVAPPICLLSSPISRAVFDRFGDRFGVPLRQGYSSSETGAVAVDSAPADEVRPDTVGRLLDGVEVRIGDAPDAASSTDETGRIWVRSPWRMGGYGFPWALDRPGAVDGWWPTEDAGRLDAGGWLTLAGRLDDCIRTRDARLVNLALVAQAVREIEGVRDAAVVALEGPAGPSFGAVVEGDGRVTLALLWTRVSDELPSWSRPRHLVLVPSIPRLANGKADRRACAAILGGAMPS